MVIRLPWVREKSNSDRDIESLISRVKGNTGRRAPVRFSRQTVACVVGGLLAMSLEQAAFAAPLAAADAPDAANAEAPDAPVVLEDVIVTGTKLPENVQSVPASVFVATAASMDRANINNFDDLVRIAPSLTITKTSQPANNSINIRGIGTYAYSIATEPSVAVVIDDIPQAFQAEAFTDLVDVHQVEVLRGPQNTLFGKSASAGVINITTEAATDTLTGKAEVLETNDHEQRYQATVSGPLSDTLKFRLAANYSEYRGNLYDLTTGSWLNGAEDSTVRGKLVWTPEDSWTVTLSPYYVLTPSTCCTTAPAFISPGVTFGKNNIPQSVILNGITVGANNTDLRNDTDARGDGLDYGSGLKMVHDMGGTSLALISSYDHYTLHDLQDTDGSDFNFMTVAPLAPPGGSANGGFFDVSTLTDELRLTSTEALQLSYVAGLYFSETDSARDFVRGSNTLGTYNTLSSLPSTNSTAYTSYLAHARAANYAVFGQSTYDFNSKFGITTGLRVNREDSSYNFDDRVHDVTYGSPGCSTTSPTLPIQTCNNQTSLTGKMSVQYHLSEDNMLFGGYSRGHKGLAYDLSSTLTTRTLLTTGPLTGIPVADAVAAKQPIPAEIVNSFEIGTKNSFFNHRLTVNVTAFDEEFHDFQAQSRDVLTGQNVLNSIGKVTSRGVETEMAAALGDLTLNGAGAYDRARMNSFPDATCYGSQTAAEGCVGGEQDLSGKPLFNAPDWNFGLNGQYDIPFTVGSFRGFVSANYHWQSQVVFSLLQDPDSVQKAYGLFGLATGAQSEHWKVMFFVENLFDQSYALERGRYSQFNISQTAVPVTDAYSWAPGRDYSRYFGIRLAATL
jgi:iron complex outermembrane receptor protein